jgi:hypothetical protein
VLLFPRTGAAASVQLFRLPMGSFASRAALQKKTSRVRVLDIPPVHGLKVRRHVHRELVQRVVCVVVVVVVVVVAVRFVAVPAQWSCTEQRVRPFPNPSDMAAATSSPRQCSLSPSGEDAGRVELSVDGS